MYSGEYDACDVTPSVPSYHEATPSVPSYHEAKHFKVVAAYSVLNIVNSLYFNKVSSFYLGYHLVVICSIENEDRSHMVASIDQFRRQFPLLTPMRGIQHYLKEQLVVSDSKMVGDVQWAPAATVDMEK
jgi:hypothetical protein